MMKTFGDRASPLWQKIHAPGTPLRIMDEVFRDTAPGEETGPVRVNESMNRRLKSGGQHFRNLAAEISAMGERRQ
jgi:hypothetical protein